MEQIINSKVCGRCKEDKSFSQFSKHKGCKFGLNPVCKTCESERQKQRQPIALTLEEKNVITKVCTVCNIEKNLYEFNKKKSGKFGLTSECKTCISERQKQHQPVALTLEEKNTIAKVCTVCNVEKSYHDFDKNKGCKFGLDSRCKTCQRERKKQKQPVALTLEEKNAITKVCTECNVEKSYYEFSKDKHGKLGIDSQCKLCKSEWHKQYNQKPEAKARKNKLYREHIKTDPKFKLDKNMSNGIRNSLKKRGSSKGGSSWLDYVDYTLEQLAQHLEKQFDDKMTWENQGSYWHIDHIISKATFNYTSPYDEEFKKCWALSNLQPLEKLDNMSKGKKSMQEWLSSKGTKDGTDC